jgi:hypothetical protein
MLKNHSGHFHREKTDFSTAILWTFFFALDSQSRRRSHSICSAGVMRWRSSLARGWTEAEAEARIRLDFIGF